MALSSRAGRKDSGRRRAPPRVWSCRCPLSPGAPSKTPRVCLSSCVCAYELSFHLRKELFLAELIECQRWLGAWLSSRGLMLSPSARRNPAVCFLLNLVENLYNMPQSGSSYFGLITPEPTLSYQPGDSPLGQGPGRTTPPARTRAPRCRQRLA